MEDKGFGFINERVGNFDGLLNEIKELQNVIETSFTDEALKLREKAERTKDIPRLYFNQKSVDVSVDIIVKTVTAQLKSALENINAATMDRIAFSVNIIGKMKNELLNFFRFGNSKDLGKNDGFGPMDTNLERLINKTKLQFKAELLKFHSRSALKECNKNGIKQYMVFYKDYKNSCAVCKMNNGFVFNIEDYEEAVTAPPFHPNCFCGIMPVMYENLPDDWESVIVEDSITGDPKGIFIDDGINIGNDDETNNTYSDNGLNYIKSWEKCRLDSYDAKPGSGEYDWTIGWGHKLHEYKGQPENPNITITQEQADRWFEEDVGKMINTTLIPFLNENNVVLTQNQFDAILSFTFNYGEYSWAENGMIMMINFLKEGDFSETATEKVFQDYINITPDSQEGNKQRRQDEMEMFLKGIYNYHY